MKWWVSCVTIRLPDDLKTFFGDQLLSDYCDAEDVLDFIRKFPDCKISMTKTSEDGSRYGASVDYSDYKNWSNEMKDYWRNR